MPVADLVHQRIEIGSSEKKLIFYSVWVFEKYAQCSFSLKLGVKPECVHPRLHQMSSEHVSLDAIVSTTNSAVRRSCSRFPGAGAQLKLFGSGDLANCWTIAHAEMRLPSLRPALVDGGKIFCMTRRNSQSTEKAFITAELICNAKTENEQGDMLWIHDYGIAQKELTGEGKKEESFIFFSSRLGPLYYFS